MRTSAVLPLAVALGATLLTGPASAQAPVDRVTSDPTGDFFADCGANTEATTGPAAMDLVGATALVDPYGGLWFVARTDGDAEEYFATNPERASFTWYLHDRTLDQSIRVIDEARGAGRRLVAEVGGEEMPWPVDKVYRDGEVNVIVSGSGVDDGDEIVWGAVSRQSDASGTRCDEVGGGTEPSITVAMGGAEASGGEPVPSTSIGATSTAGASGPSDVDGGDGDEFPSTAVAAGAGVLVVLGAVILVGRRRRGGRGGAAA
ncbi:MAG: hypothetical protein M5T61_05970 [Acidimicrobiia bacterium]|nr:hypothetical protein [Acidimicrobiia bacterium]